jgi:hypothetical protein
MNADNQLAPCLIGRGTTANPADMLRALETLENVEYRFTTHGEVTDEGAAALVKLMADSESATMVVNGCLFLNIFSFRYLDFEPSDSERWRFTLHGDSLTLELVSVPESDETPSTARRPHLLLEESVPGFESLIVSEEDDEDE